MIEEPVRVQRAVEWLGEERLSQVGLVLLAAGLTLFGATDGFAVLVLSPGWIEHLYVDPSLTGRGIGSLLVDHAKGLSDELALWTFVSNDGAQRFYERHGFELVGTDAIEPLLRKYWTVPDSQIAASVVLANVSLQRLGL